MSTIFRHGRLRLYLLKLLDESPRHGYEIISLLRDRFLGVYSPSPGTIYPRLARLEEEGLVTHEEVNGRKVYRLTDKGRAELHSRTEDLSELERELTDSVRDVARAVKHDVRDTISSLRQELKFTATDTRKQGRSRRPDDDVWGQASTEEPEPEPPGGERAREGEHGAWWQREWERDWERLASGFSSLGETLSGRAGTQHSRTELDRLLRDFSAEAKRVLREAGDVGDDATADLRRILDDAIATIRQDIAHWGPPESGGSTSEPGEPAKDDSPGEPGEPGTTGEPGTRPGV